MPGVTELGFELKTFDEVLAGMQAEARANFGEDIDLTDESPLGLFVKLASVAVYEAWEDLLDVFNAGYVDSATGICLDYVAKYIGLRRRPAVAATGQVTFTGTNGTVIPVGFLVELNNHSVKFATTAAVTITSGTATVGIQCQTTGKIGNCAIGTITQITQPQQGINTVNNTTATGDTSLGYQVGMEIETDADFRDRYKISTSIGGASTPDAIRANVLAQNNVRAVRVYENKTMTTDTDGRPPKSVEVVVMGGTDNDIATAIMMTKAGGIQAYGTTYINLPDLSNNIQQIGFSRAAPLSVWVTVNITKTGVYPSDGNKQVQTAIIKHIGGVDADNISHQGLSMNENVIVSKLLAAVFEIGEDKITDVTITLGTTASPTGTTNIVVNQRQVAVTDATKVVVNSA